MKSIIIKDRYEKTCESIRFLAQIAHQEGWRLPVGRSDLRCKEMIINKEFGEAIKKYLESFEHD